MSFHRIEKYCRHVVCQDMILSCQSNNIEEIPLFKRAGISKLSLRKRRATLGEVSSTKDLYLSGMLVNWHLWNRRGVPLSHPERDATLKGGRRSVSESRKIVCESSLTLRKEGLCIAIEKYLLFLMPRDVTRKRVLPAKKQSYIRRDCVRLSAFYVDSALGLRQYFYDSEKAQHSMAVSQWNTLLPERIQFPRIENNILMDTCVPQMPGKDKEVPSVQQLGLRFPHNTPFTQQSCVTKSEKFCPHSGRRSRPNLSLYCPSILNSPDIQDIAQSGLMTLEGHVTLELS